MLSGVNGLSVNTSVVKSEWIVREHKCCKEWISYQRTQVLSGVDKLSENTSVIRSGWIVREHKRCQQMNCQRTQMLSGAMDCQRTQVLSGVDRMSENTGVIRTENASVVRSGWIVGECKCCEEWMDCQRMQVSGVMHCQRTQVLQWMNGLSEWANVSRNGWDVR